MSAVLLSVSMLIASVAADEPAIPEGIKWVDQGTVDADLKGIELPVGFRLEVAASDPLPADAVRAEFAADGSLLVLCRPADQPSRLVRIPALGKPAVVLPQSDGTTAFTLHGSILVTARAGSVAFDGKPIVRGFTAPIGGLTTTADGRVLIACPPQTASLLANDGSKLELSGTGTVVQCRFDGCKLALFAAGIDKPLELRAEETGLPLLIEAGLRDGNPGTWFQPIRPQADASLRGRSVFLQRTIASFTFANEAAFPSFYRGFTFAAAPPHREIIAARIQGFGSGIECEYAFPFLRSSRADFAPAAVTIGMDGGLYFIAGAKSTLYRVRWVGGLVPGDDLVEAEIKLRDANRTFDPQQLADEEIVEKLAADLLHERLTAQIEVRRRGDKVLPTLTSFLTNEAVGIVGRQTAIGALPSAGSDEIRSAVLKALRAQEAAVRRSAADFLTMFGKSGDPELHEALLTYLGDPDPNLRATIARTIAHIAAPGSADVLVNAWKFDEGKDVLLSSSLTNALELLGEPGMTALLALADSGNEKELGRIVSAFLTYRTPTARAALDRLIANTHLTEEQKAALVKHRAAMKEPPR